VILPWLDYCFVLWRICGGACGEPLPTYSFFIVVSTEINRYQLSVLDFHNDFCKEWHIPKTFPIGDSISESMSSFQSISLNYFCMVCYYFIF
jgi:hypothetical protein